MSLRFSNLLVLSLVVMPALADVYRWVDADGRVIYGDSPPGTRRHDPVELPPLSEGPGAPTHEVRQRGTSDTAGSARMVHAPTPKASLDHCLRTKRSAIKAERRRNRAQAADLDSWLWRHCRAFARELRSEAQRHY